MIAVKTVVTSRDVNWSRFKEAARSFKLMHTQVGLPERGTFKPNGVSKVKRYKDLIKVALINEFGGKHTPERALFRITFKQNEKAISRMMNTGARDIVLGKTNIKAVLSNIGEFLVQKIRNNIMKGMPPGNAPSTIQHKGFDKPMLETGQLYDNIQHREVMGNARS
jgi:hypothetical protein